MKYTQIREYVTFKSHVVIKYLFICIHFNEVHAMKF